MNLRRMEFLKNRELPERAGFGRTLENILGFPFRILELLGAHLFVRPTRFLLQQLDPLSHKLEGTWIKTVLEYTLFPVTMIITLYFGFKFAEEGVTIASITTLALIPVIYGLIFAPLERLLPFNRDWLEGDNEATVDLMFFISGILSGAFSRYLISVLLIINLVEWLKPIGLDIWPSYLHPMVQVFLFLLIKDFFRYWYHRWLHEVPFLWRWHAVHHSVERLYWMNGIRAHPIEVIAQNLIWAVPLALVQPGAEVVMVSVLMALSIGIFQHSNMQLRLGFFEYIFSIGDNHRYHHYPNKEVGDSNYGGEFIVWDILFGTFHNPRNERPDAKMIGIGTAPNYPQTLMGLMIAPFLPNQKVMGPENDPEDEPQTETDPSGLEART